MIHGNVTEFKKLFNLSATHHNNEILINLVATMMGQDVRNETIPAGWTYFGQFVDHDLTFDKEGGINARTPIFDLDSLYGEGPDSTRHRSLFEGDADKQVFRIGNLNNKSGDLLRDDGFIAKIPDPRNDENIIVASLQLLFQKFHNILVDSEGLNFIEAKNAVQWHYQSIVLFDFLPKIIGEAKINDILKNGRKVFTPNSIDEVFMPTEYSGACYRFGHSMVRERYSFNDIFNDARTNNNLFFGFPGGRPEVGGHQITEIWTLQGNGNSLMRFFDPSILDVQFDADNLSGKIDTKLPTVLTNLEVPTGENNILALRNLQSGQRLGLANGQQVATELLNLGVSVNRLSEGEILSDGEPFEISNNTPLWFYILKEAGVQNEGNMLGDVGGTIVGETIIGSLQVDPNSLLNRQEKPWPFKVGEANTDFVSMVQLISYVDENSN